MHNGSHSVSTPTSVFTERKYSCNYDFPNSYTTITWIVNLNIPNVLPCMRLHSYASSMYNLESFSFILEMP